MAFKMLWCFNTEIWIKRKDFSCFHEIIYTNPFSGSFEHETISQNLPLTIKIPSENAFEIHFCVFSSTQYDRQTLNISLSITRQNYDKYLGGL